MPRIRLAARSISLSVLAAMPVGAAFAPWNAAVAQDGAAKLALDRAAGRTLKYSVALSVRLEQASGGAAAEKTEIGCEADLVLAFGATSPAGDTEVKITIDSLRAVRNDAQGMLSVALPKVTTEADPTEGRAAAMLAVQRAIKAATITLTIDPEGRITGVDGLSAAEEELGKRGELDRTALGIFDMDYLRETLAPLFTADGASKGPRRAGDGWQSEETIGLGPAGGVRTTTDWSVAEVSPTAVKYEGKPSLAVLKPAAPDEMTPSLEIAEQTASVQAEWSREAKAMASRTARQTARTIWTLGDEKMEQKQTISSAITLKK